MGRTPLALLRVSLRWHEVQVCYLAVKRAGGMGEGGGSKMEERFLLLHS